MYKGSILIYPEFFKTAAVSALRSLHLNCIRVSRNWHILNIMLLKMNVVMNALTATDGTDCIDIRHMTSST